MDISSLTNISSDYITQAYNQSKAASAQEENGDSFSSIFDTAVKMLNETNDYQNDAEAAEVRFMLGEATNTHELAAIQTKANLALNYTIAVRDKVLEAYREIMNMTIQWVGERYAGKCAEYIK